MRLKLITLLVIIIAIFSTAHIQADAAREGIESAIRGLDEGSRGREILNKMNEIKLVPTFIMGFACISLILGLISLTRTNKNDIGIYTILISISVLIITSFLFRS